MSITIPPQYVLFAAEYNDDMVEEARRYIYEHGLTYQDVRIVKTYGGDVLVKTKREIGLPERDGYSESLHERGEPSGGGAV
jgi:predicted O-methyltransferase YrrM